MNILLDEKNSIDNTYKYLIYKFSQELYKKRKKSIMLQKLYTFCLI